MVNSFATTEKNSWNVQSMKVLSQIFKWLNATPTPTPTPVPTNANQNVTKSDKLLCCIFLLGFKFRISAKGFSLQRFLKLRYRQFFIDDTQDDIEWKVWKLFNGFLVNVYWPEVPTLNDFMIYNMKGFSWSKTKKSENSVAFWTEWLMNISSLWLVGCGGGQVLSLLGLYSNDLSSNTAGYWIYCTVL